MLMAIMRGISPRFAECEITHIAREPIDLARAHAEHGAYAATLRSLGIGVQVLPAEESLPDCVFVEDTALVLPECAVITRPGAASRRPETMAIAGALSRHRTLHTLQAPGTLDGGDVLVLGKRVLVGTGGRSNAAGIAQLGEFLQVHGYRVEPVPVRGCLHLKSAVTQVSSDTLLLNPAWVDAALLDGFRLIEVDPREPDAANALRVGERVVYAEHHPHTRDRLHGAGIEPVLVPAREVAKAEGAVTCCSLVFGAGDQGAQ